MTSVTKHKFDFLERNGVVILIILVAAVLRLYRLSTYPLWLDETDTLYAAVQHLYVYPPLFFCLLTAWTPIAANDFMLRLLPAIIGIAGVFMTWKLALEITDRRTANVAGILIAAAPFAVYYSQELRMYGLLLTLSAWAWIRFFKYMQAGSRTNLLLYTLSISLTIYTHHYAFFLFAAQFLAALSIKPLKPALKRVTLGLLLAGISYLPYIARFLFLFNRFSQSNFWAPPITLDTVTYTMRILTSSYESGPRVYIILAGLILITGTAAMFTRIHKNVLRLWFFGFITPLALALLTSLVLPTSMYVPRYVVYVLPPMLIASAAGIKLLSNRVIHQSTLIIAILLLQGVVLTNHYSNQFATKDIPETRPRKQFREPASVIVEEFQEGDAIGTTCLSGSGPCWYYLHYRKGLPMSIQLDLNGRYAAHLQGKYNMNDYIDEHYPFFKPIETTEVARSHRRLWLYATQWNTYVSLEDFHFAHRLQVTQWFKERFPQLIHLKYYGVELHLFDLENPYSETPESAPPDYMVSEDEKYVVVPVGNAL